MHQQHNPILPDTRPVLDPYRSLGSILSGPFALQTSPTIALICPTYSSYKIYTPTLSLQNISPNFSHPVSAITGDGDKVYVRVGSHVYKMNYYHILRQWEFQASLNSSNSNPTSSSSLMKIGEALILLEGNSAAVFLDSREEQSEQAFKVFRVGFEAKGIVHPLTYVNKIIIYGGHHNLELWNFSRGERVFSFTDSISKIVDKSDRLLTVEPSPACDVLCLSFESGRLLMYNIKTNKLVFELKQKNGAVSLAFSQNAKSLLATGDNRGSIIFWDLEEKRILSKLEQTHGFKPVDSLVFMPHQLLLVSGSSADNSVKQWKYDQIEQSSFRLLRHRSSISQSLENFKIQSNQEVVLNTENQTCYLSLLSENNTYLLPRCLDSRLPTHISATKGHYLNVYKNQTIVKTIPIGEKPVIGRISMSQSFFVVATPNKVVRVGSGDTLTWRIPGVRSIALYQQHSIFALTSSALYVLDFCNNQVAPVIINIEASEQPKFLVQSDLASFMALAYKNRVEVWDMKNCKKGRTFKTTASDNTQVTSVCFSPDNRYLLVGSGTYVEIFNIINSTLQKSIQLQSPATHLSITPDNNFLVSAFENSREINLWHNLIGVVSSSVELQHIHFATVISKRDQDLRKYLSKNAQDKLLKKEESTEENYAEFDFEGYLDELEDANDGLTSFTDMPISKWMPLAYYDEIKQRNRPKANLQKRIEAPFFLDFKKKDELVNKMNKEHESESKKQNRILNEKTDELLRNQTRAIDFENPSTYQNTFQILKTLTPAEFDYEIRTYLLLPTNCATLVEFVNYLVSSGEEIDIKLVYAFRCLSVMGTDILQEEVREKLRELKARITANWEKVNRSMNMCSAVVSKLVERVTV